MSITKIFFLSVVEVLYIKFCFFLFLLLLHKLIQILFCSIMECHKIFLSFCLAYLFYEKPHINVRYIRTFFSICFPSGEYILWLFINLSVPLLCPSVRLQLLPLGNMKLVTKLNQGREKETKKKNI